MTEKHMEPIVPVQMRDGTTTPDDLRMIREKYGIRRFFLCGPGLSVRILGYPGMEVYEAIGHRILAIREALSDTDIEINWWCAPSIKCGLNAPYQHIVNVDGTESPHGLCPLDPGVRRDLAERVARVAEIAHPPIIQFEDDFELSNHPGVSFGCFCPLHLAAFAEKAGRFYTREELMSLYRKDEPETMPLRKLFAETAKESLCLLAADIRAALDQVAPETRVSVCEPGTTDADGYVSIDEPRAFSGKNTKPLIRVYGSFYSCSDSPHLLPDVMAHTMFTAERLPADFEWMHESDTYPHTSFYMSAAFLETEINAALAMGADNTLLYAAQYLDDPAEDPSYFEMYRRNAKRFDAFREAACPHLGTLDGCWLIHDPMTTSTKRLSPKPRGAFSWVCGVFGRMGIPYSTKYGSPAILAGLEAELVPDKELEDLLKSGLLLDVNAAEILEKRGYGDLIGVSLQPIEKLAFNSEILADVPEFSDIRGRRIYNFAFAPAGGEKVPYADLKPHENAQVLSFFCDPLGNKVQPGMVRFTNRLGGRICVLASTLDLNQSSNLYCPRKQKMLHRMLNWLRGEALPAATDSSNVWLLVRNTPKGTLFCITVLCADGRNDLLLDVAEKFCDMNWTELDDSGEWQPAVVERQSRSQLILKGKFKSMRMRIFRAQ